VTPSAYSSSDSPWFFWSSFVAGNRRLVVHRPDPSIDTWVRHSAAYRAESRGDREKLLGGPLRGAVAVIKYQSGSDGSLEQEITTTGITVNSLGLA